MRKPTYTIRGDQTHYDPPGTLAKVQGLKACVLKMRELKAKGRSLYDVCDENRHDCDINDYGQEVYSNGLSEREQNIIDGEL